MEQKNYYAIECDVTTRDFMLKRERYYFFGQNFKPDDRYGNIPITINGETFTLCSLTMSAYQRLIEADILAIRFLKEGISRTPIGKVLNQHESNLWQNVLNEMDNVDPDYVGSFYDKKLYEFYGSDYADYRHIHPLVESAYDKHGTIMKAGKFAKLLGCSDAEAEQFSKDYNIAFGNMADDGYEYKVVSGHDIVKYYDDIQYPERNSSPLWGSCMNSKDNIVQWYAKNCKHVRLAVLLKNNQVHARAIIWNNVSIEKWGHRTMVRTEDKVVYKGSLADRQYYYSDKALFTFRQHFKKSGIAYKECTSWGDGSYQIPIVSDDTLTTAYWQYDSDNLIIYSKVTRIKGKVPYLDSLMYMSDKKIVSNKVTDGLIVKCNSTRGETEHIGTYTTARIGLDDGWLSRIDLTSNLHRVLFPHGEESGVVPNKFNIPTTRIHAKSDVYVITHLAQCKPVQLKRVRKGKVLVTDRVLVYVYPNQLEFDIKQNDFVVTKLWAEDKQCYAPVSEFVLSVDRYGNYTKLHHRPLLSKRLNKAELQTI